MNNKQILIEAIKKASNSFKLGCYSDIIDNASKRTVNRLIEVIGDYSDIKCTIQSETYYIEVCCVQFEDYSEIDFVALTESQYSRYS